MPLLRFISVWMFLLILAWPVNGIAGSSVIKIATVAPEGSTWSQILYQFAKEAGEKTANAVRFKIYAGGVSGDEMDVLRKMRVGRIHAAGFSGVGLGVLLPEVRILEAPLLFKDYSELDYIKAALFDRFEKGFNKKGYILLGFAEAGFVYFYAKSNLSGVEALGKVKMWAWKGDPVAKTFLETFGIRTYPLHVADVNTGLETGMIDAFYSPPLAALAFQWYTRIQYVLDFPMVNSSGAFLMTRRAFSRLSPEHQKTIRKLALKYCKKLVHQSRMDNNQALEIFKAAGIERVSPTDRQLSAFRINAQKTHDKSIPSLYSRGLYKEVSTLLEKYRTGQ